MISTKEPLYKKKYHAAHQLYPKITGGRGVGSAQHPTNRVGGMELSLQNALR